MKIKGMDSWLERIETLEREFPKETGQFLLKQANIVIRDVKQDTPVDTGTLRNAWHRTGKSERKAFTQIVYNNTDYVNHVEYGHRLKRGGKIVGFIQGRRMLHKAMFNRKLNFYKDLDKMMKKLMR